MNGTLGAYFGFTKLVVQDLEKEAEFYRAVMGYADGQTIESEIGGRRMTEIVFTGPGGKTELILLSYSDGPPASCDGVIVGFFTSDIEAFEARALAAGATVLQPLASVEHENGVTRLAFYTDPEGFPIEVIQT